MTGGLTLAWTDQAGRRRRVRLERRDVGGWTRRVEEYSDGQWRPVGGEIVADVDVELDATVTDAVDVVPPADGGAAEVLRGP